MTLVRLPASVRHGRVRGVHRADLVAMDQVRRRGSRVPHTMFPCMPGVCDPARCVYALPEQRARCCPPRVRSASAPRWAISGLHTLPARSPVNASRTPLPRPAHDSGPAWLARPSLSETCTLSHRAGLSRHTLTLTVAASRERRVYSPALGRGDPAELLKDLLTVRHPPCNFI
jgi:hypothetical protein